LTTRDSPATLFSNILCYILYVLGSLSLSVFLGGAAIAGLNIFKSLAYYEGSPDLCRKPHKPHFSFLKKMVAMFVCATVFFGYDVRAADDGCLTLNMMDSYGDGWTGGAALSFTSVETGDTFMAGLSLGSGKVTSREVCFGCGCYFGQATAGDYPEENSWKIQDSSEATLAAAEGDAASESFCPVSGSCFSCAVGRASNIEGTACDPCPAGRYNDVDGVFSACTACGAGTYSEVTGSTSVETCVKCATGSYTPPGASFCVLTPDVAVLVSIATAIGYNFWDFSADSSTTMGDVCASAMATCDEMYSSVIGIHIIENPVLQGASLSDFVALSELKRIEKLELFGNGLTGRLPKKWGTEMKTLKYLDLAPNKLEGTLPLEWAALTSLEQLYLSFNQLEGTLPLEWAALTNLQILYLYDNQLEGTLPLEWAALTSLQTLDLSSNQLEGTLPLEWAALTSLEQIYLSFNQLDGGLELTASFSELLVFDISGNRFDGSLSFVGAVCGSLLTLDLSRNLFDHTVLPSYFAVSPGNSRLSALTVDLRGMDFDCPFPTAEEIRLASKSGSGFQTLVLRDPCRSGYGNFLVHYTLPALGALVVLYCAWQLVRRSKHKLALRISRPLRTDGDDVTQTSHKRLKAIFVLSFALMVYDIYNDASVYESMIAVVDNRAFENPCEAPNFPSLFYPAHIKFEFTNADGSIYPDEYTNFSKYLEYVDDWVYRGLILGSSRDANVDEFAEYCESFYVVNGVHECAYSDVTKGAEGCVRVENVQQKNNRRFKKFIVASLTIVCMKELAKLLLVLGIWLRASDRKLGPCELGLIAESPFLLLLLWRRPKFLGELLLAPRSLKSLQLVFFFEDVCHSINLLAVAVYFALYVDQQGIAFNIMMTLFTSSLSFINKGRVGAREWWKEVTDLPEAHVDLSDVVEGQQEGSDAIVTGETASCRGCGGGEWGRCWVGCGRWGGSRCSTLFRRGGAQPADAPRVEDGIVLTNNPLSRKTIGDLEMTTVA